MAWNEPGGGSRDPWRKDDRKRPGKPWSAEQAWQRLKRRLGRFGGGAGGIFTVVLALLIAWLLISSYVVVGANQAGVLLQFGSYARTLTPGLHFKLPAPLQTVVKVDIARLRSTSDHANFLTRDGNVVVVDFTVQYRATDARKYLYAQDDADGTLAAAAESAVRDVIGRSDLGTVLAGGGAAQVAQARQALQRTLAGYDAGLAVIDLSFQGVAPPAQVKDAFDDVDKAREDAQAAQDNARAEAGKLTPAARADATRVAADANGYKAERIAQATGDVARFNLLLKAYQAAPEATRHRMWLETMEDVLARNPTVIDGSGGRNVINLPRAPANAASAAAAPEPSP